MDYTNKSIEELDATLLELGETKEQIRAEMKLITDARNSKLVTTSWSEKVKDMSDAEKASLMSLLNVQTAEVTGIESREDVTRLNHPDDE